MEYLGYFFSILIGVSLGLIGGGGSILTVPVLVYIFGMDAVAATVYSLFVVGITSAVGAANYFTKGFINLKTALLFGIPSITAVLLTRVFIIPAIPAQLGSIGGIQISKHALLMVLFAVLMLLAAYHMITKSKTPPAVIQNQSSANYSLIVMQGLLTGTITGFIGAGGGFMIIPALVLLLKLPMKEAIGTSLLIITANSLIGFAGSVTHTPVRWHFMLGITALAVAGIFTGMQLSKKIDGEKLKPAFGWFVLLMGIFIIIKETLHRN